MTFLIGFLTGAATMPFIMLAYRWLFSKSTDALETEDK